jgi:hypothetical protein
MGIPDYQLTPGRLFVFTECHPYYSPLSMIITRELSVRLTTARASMISMT